MITRPTRISCTSNQAVSQNCSHRMEIPSASSRLCFLMDYDSPSVDRYILPWVRRSEESHCGSRRDSCRISTSDYETIVAQRSAGRRFLARINSDGGNLFWPQLKRGYLIWLQKPHCLKSFRDCPPETAP